jgi:hypothetical protein
VAFVRLARAFKQTPYGTGLRHIQHKAQMTAVTGCLSTKVYGPAKNSPILIRSQIAVVGKADPTNRTPLYAPVAWFRANSNDLSIYPDRAAGMRFG